MLEQQDLVIIREIVGEEIGSKTSDLRQDVSVLKQDVSSLKQDVSGLKQDVSGLKQDVSGLKQDLDRKFNHLGVLIEDQRKTMQIILENLVQNNNKIDQMFGVKDKVDQHEIRINSLELAVKKKTDLRLI